MSSSQASSPSKDQTAIIAICAFLLVAVWFVFGQTSRFEFVNYDDDHHVYANAAITNGVSADGLAWAFHHSQRDYWHPLDFVSHMVDCQLYGLKPGGHHFTNVLLHAGVSIVLFLVLQRMTGALWLSAFVALVFAIHPQRVESVAWVSQRKDILHGLFFALGLGAYFHYARQAWSWRRYLMVVLLFALGLMCKPTLMPFPLLLLLLDFWPLRRWPGPRSPLVSGKPAVIPTSSTKQLLLEKIPMLALSFASCVEAATGNRNAFLSSHVLPISTQVGNALVSYIVYVWQMLWPAHLAVLYPYPIGGIPLWQVLVAGSALVSISVAAFILRHRAPYLFVGWFWYLIMMAPMIGFVQAGSYARADRYTYLPHLGLYILLVSAAGSVLRWRPQWKPVFAGGAVVGIIALISQARLQTTHWRNSELLWTHTLSCTSSNAVAHQNLAAALAKQGRVEDSIDHFQTAIQLNPNMAETHNNLGLLLNTAGRVTEGILHFQKAIALKPSYAEAINNLGMALAQMNQMAQARDRFQEAITARPDYADAQYNFALALTALGKLDEAESHYRKAISINPGFAEAHHNLATVLVRRGAVPEAIGEFQAAVAIKPDYADAHYNLGILFASQQRLPEATSHFEQAIRFAPETVDAHRQLAALLARLGRTNEAAVHLREADRLDAKTTPAPNAVIYR